jgi:hypothetical protein
MGYLNVASRQKFAVVLAAGNGVGSVSDVCEYFAAVLAANKCYQRSFLGPSWPLVNGPYFLFCGRFSHFVAAKCTILYEFTYF